MDSSRDGEGERAKVAHCLVPRSPCACRLLCKINTEFRTANAKSCQYLHSVDHFSFFPFQLPSAPPPPTAPISLTEPANSTGPRPPTALEQSLASISQFDHTHLGQIGKGTQGKDNQSQTIPCIKSEVKLCQCIQKSVHCVSCNFSDDILETFLSEYHQKRHRSSKSATSATDLCDKGESEEEEEEEEECFMTPELPSGQELTIVILSTWGDKYYVGLSSIEVFTASGEMAAVQKVRGRRRKYTESDLCHSCVTDLS